VRIAPDDERPRDNVPLLDHHLMRDARARGIKVDAMLFRERVDLRVLAEVLRRDVLDVVIDREHGLTRVVDAGRADLFELGDDRARVVVRHHVLRPDRHEVARAHELAGREAHRVARRDLFDKRLSHPPYSAREWAHLPAHAG
jgi:hypothetical protein